MISEALPIEEMLSLLTTSTNITQSLRKKKREILKSQLLLRIGHFPNKSVYFEKKKKNSENNEGLS